MGGPALATCINNAMIEFPMYFILHMRIVGHIMDIIPM